jgi:hypothetical protein
MEKLIIKKKETSLSEDIISAAKNGIEDFERGDFEIQFL